jgi:hypothetical protein
MDQRSRIDDLVAVQPRNGAGDDITYSIMLLRGQEACRRNAFTYMVEVVIPNRSQLKVRP